MTRLEDRDLLSVQEVRDLVARAKEAQKCLATFSQARIDELVQAVMMAAMRNSPALGRLARDETGFGKAEDKTLKNFFAASSVYEAIKDLKTVGIVKEDKVNRMFEVAVPVGVVAGECVWCTLKPLC